MADTTLMPLSPLLRGEKPKTRRIYLVRNGESCDRLGPTWRHKAFKDHGIYRVVDLNQPVRIMDRAPDAFLNDTPLTQVGAMSAQLLGRGMHIRSAGVHTVFSSPALRCVQTASAMIGSLNMKTVPKINIEPSLVDPLSFYWQDRLPSFFTPEHLIAGGYPIEPEYEPLSTVTQLSDSLFHEKTPDDFSIRLGKIASKIVESSKERISGGVLVVSHAPVIDGLLRIITDVSERPRTTADLNRMGLSYPFCSVIALEQSARSMKWTLLLEAIPPLTHMHLTTAITVPNFE